jgi:hypothetical protein
MCVVQYGSLLIIDKHNKWIDCENWVSWNGLNMEWTGEAHGLWMNKLKRCTKVKSNKLKNVASKERSMLYEWHCNTNSIENAYSTSNVRVA